MAKTLGIGNQGNAWNNTTGQTCGANGVSTAIDSGGNKQIALFGHAGGATTLTCQVSQDNVTWYATSVTATLSGASDFNIDHISAARYHRLLSSADVQMVATIAAKE